MAKPGVINLNCSRTTFARAAFVGASILNIIAVRGNAQITQLGANLYAVEGSGVTVGALVGPDGVLLVDSGYREADTSKIMAVIRSISDAPVRLVVNTSARIDHTGGNENLAKLGVTILGRPQVRERLAHPVFSTNGMVGTGTHLVQAPFHQLLQLRPAGFYEMLAHRALLQAVGFGELAHRLAVLARAQAQH